MANVKNCFRWVKPARHLPFVSSFLAGISFVLSTSIPPEVLRARAAGNLLTADHALAECITTYTATSSELCKPDVLRVDQARAFIYAAERPQNRFSRSLIYLRLVYADGLWR